MIIQLSIPGGRNDDQDPNFCLKKITGRNILLLERFDRTHSLNRVPFLSAMAMLGASDGDTGSYLEIGEILMEHGANPQKDLMELWRRIVFNIMISNVDDPLRNHGSLYDHRTSGWHLSPLYDLEPAPEHIKSRFLRTNIDFYNNAASLDLAYEVAEEFGLKSHQAKTIAKEVADSVNQWAREADRFGTKKQEIEFMSSAFEHDNLKQAL
ncbi:MAG: HipA domain-containing protein [Desulfobacteraceae bacterium]